MILALICSRVSLVCSLFNAGPCIRRGPTRGTPRNDRHTAARPYRKLRPRRQMVFPLVLLSRGWLRGYASCDSLIYPSVHSPAGITQSVFHQVPADAHGLAPPAIVEQTQLHLFRVPGKQREIDAFTIPAGARRIRVARPDRGGRIVHGSISAAKR